MNSDRARLSIAVLISIAVHGVIASFGDFSAAQGTIATNTMPVAVTIGSVPKAEMQQPERSLQESKSDVVEPVEPEDSVPEKIVPEQSPPIQSATEPAPTPKLEPDRARTVETATPAPAQPSPDMALVDELAGSSHATSTARIPIPAKPDVTAVPLYHLIPKPAYPSRSRDLGEEGRVIIAVLVSEDGSVLEAYISESSGYALLDGSALATVTERWRFKPGKIGGKAVASWVRVPIKFSIKGS